MFIRGLQFNSYVKGKHMHRISSFQTDFEEEWSLYAAAYTLEMVQWIILKCSIWSIPILRQETAFFKWKITLTSDSSSFNKTLSPLHTGFWLEFLFLYFLEILLLLGQGEWKVSKTKSWTAYITEIWWNYRTHVTVRLYAPLLMLWVYSLGIELTLWICLPAVRWGSAGNAYQICRWHKIGWKS